MSSRHEVRAFDYVNRPYQAVCDALFAGPLAVFRQATTKAGAGDATRGADLHVKAGALNFGAEVIIEVVAIEATRSPDGQPATNFALRWKAMRRPGWFPTMRATLMIYPLTATETQLQLEGTYAPPLGVLGDALDALGLHKLAEASVTGFVRDVAAHLRT